MNRKEGIETRELVWKAMGEADIHRRYYSSRRDRLRKHNTCFLAGAWVLSLAGALLSLGLFGDSLTEWAVAFIITAAALTTFRDVLGLPDRIAEARATAIMANEEYDTMRILWDTGGQFRPAAEFESFHRTSRASNFANESIHAEMLETARQESVQYHEKLGLSTHRTIAAPSAS